MSQQAQKTSTEKDRVYRLMIKTHMVTGLRYLCVTCKQDHIGYKGSGTRWLNHLKVHGRFVSTETLFETDNLVELSHAGAYFSDILDVVASDAWANLIPEHGYSSEPVCALWAKLELDPEGRAEFITSRNASIKTSWQAQDMQQTGRRLKSLHDGRDAYLSTLSREDHIKITEKARSGAKAWYQSLSPEDRAQYHARLTLIHTERWRNLSEEDRAEFSAKVSAGRLKLSDEGKLKRKMKIREGYAADVDGKHEAYRQRLKSERVGRGNPAAVTVIIDGVSYPTIRDAVQQLGLKNEHRLRNLRRKGNRNTFSLSELM